MFRILLFISLLLPVSGCGNSKENADARSGHDDHHDQHEGEEEEHGHLAHHVPAHKPADYSALVEQLAIRIEGLSSRWSAENSAEQTAERQELADIIHWIPELAADSELQKPAFEKAVNAGHELHSMFEKQFALSAKSKPEAKVFTPVLESLKSLVPTSKAP